MPSAQPSAIAWHRREQQLVLACLLAICALAWLALLRMLDSPAMAMVNMDMAGMVMDQAAPRAWDAAMFWLMLAMWIVMMIGMMLPSALPMILLYQTVLSRSGRPAYRETGLFAAAYLLVWAGFGLAATLLQWGLEQLALLSPMLTSNSQTFGGSVLIAAGIYQYLPLKQACLAHCHSPLHFVTHHWQAGLAGAWRMGLRHGLYCLGCCWVLMGLLFVFGLMNLLWIGLLSALVLLEKLLPWGRWLSRLSGLLLLAWGLRMLLGGGIT